MKNLGILRFLRGVFKLGNVRKIDKLKTKTYVPTFSHADCIRWWAVFFSAVFFSTVRSAMVENRLLKFPELENNINKKGKVVKKWSGVTL